MAMFEMKHGAVMDMLTNGELGEALTLHQKNWFKEMARGVKHMNTPAVIGTPSGGSITLPSPGETIGPRSGYTWAIQSLSVFGLATNDVIQIYNSVANPANFKAQVTQTTPFLYFGDKGLILKDNETLILSGTTAATGQIVFNASYVECPTVDIWKIISNS